MLKSAKSRALSAAFGAACGTFGGLGALSRGEQLYGTLTLIGAAMAVVLAAMFAFEAWEQRGQ